MTKAQRRLVLDYVRLGHDYYRETRPRLRLQAERILALRGEAELRHRVWWLHDPYKD